VAHAWDLVFEDACKDLTDITGPAVRLIAFIDNHAPVREWWKRQPWSTHLTKPPDTRFAFVWLLVTALGRNELNVKKLFADDDIGTWSEKAAGRRSQEGGDRSARTIVFRAKALP